MPTTKLPNGRQQFTNPSTGAPLVGGRVWHYVPGTSVLKDTYQDIDGAVLNTNPVILDAYGSAAIWGNGAYRQVLLDASDNQLWDEVTTSGISQAMAGVVGADTTSGAMTALGISAAWQPVISNATLSGGMVTMGISLAMQPVVAAATTAEARTLLGIDSVGFQVYNVKAYGAVGDGLTDDTAAINAAMAACAVGIVYFPSGAYKITSTITLKPGVAIWGNSMMTSTVIAGVNNLTLFAYNATALVNAFEFFNIGLYSGGFTGCTGINLNGTDATKRISIVNLLNVYAASFTYGVYMKFCANVVVDNYFANICDTGIWWDQCGDVAATNSKAQNGTGTGFYVSGGPGATDEGIKLVNCSTNGQAYGFQVSGQEWGQITNCSFTTCTGGPGVFLSSAAWRVVNTDLSAANGVAGLYIDAGCSNIQVSDCFIALNTFGVYSLGTRVTISGNNFTGNSNVDIYLDNASVTSVAGNICDSVGAAQSIWEAGTTNYSAITGNVVIGTVVVSGANSVQTGTVSY